MAAGLCPKCDHRIELGDDPEIGQRCQCKLCRADLVVVWLNPIELAVVDYDEFDRFEGDFYGENFQKIKKGKGDFHANRKAQEDY